MSELTKCNYCSLKRMRDAAFKENADIVLRPSGGLLGGVDVFFVPEGETLPKKSEMIAPTRDFPNGNEAYSKYHRAWFWELTKHCAC